MRGAAVVMPAAPRFYLSVFVIEFGPARRFAHTLAHTAIVPLNRPKTQSSQNIFPSVRSWHRPISDKTLNAALRRLGYDKTELTVHGVRSTASALSNESGKWHADAIERQLAHQEANEVRDAYTHAAEIWQERVRMMRWWTDELDQLG
jgi:integrase